MYFKSLADIILPCALDFIGAIALAFRSPDLGACSFRFGSTCLESRVRRDGPTFRPGA